MRFTFKDRQEFNCTFNTGSVVHLAVSETRVDNEDDSELDITMTLCGQESPSMSIRSFFQTSKPITCKRCLKKLAKRQRNNNLHN